MPFDSNRYAIAIHTSSPQLGLAITNFADRSRCQTWELGRSLATHFHHHLAEFIQPQTWQDLAFIAVAIGPGGFTGTRIGVVAARTLAQQLEIPLFGISTLAAVAWSSQEKGKTDLSQTAIAVQMNAQRGQLFGGIYQIASDRIVTLLPDRVMSPEMWQQTLENWETPIAAIAVPTNLGESATSMLDLAYWEWEKGARPHWSEALPFYGQHPVER